MPELAGGASIIWKMVSFNEGRVVMVTPQVLLKIPVFCWRDVRLIRECGVSCIIGIS
jgi:hypothetical protein